MAAREANFKVVLLEIKKVGMPYKELRFKTTNPRFGKPRLSVEVYVRTEIEKKLIKVDSYADLGPSSLGFYMEETMNYIRAVEEDDKDYNERKNNVAQMSSLFDVMEALTGLTWVY